MLGFKKRKYCPSCHSTNLKSIYCLEFKNEKIASFLKNYYKNKIRINDLGNNQFNLIKCSCCTLIFQEQILDDEGMSKLYDQFIDPKFSLQKRESANLSYFNSLYLDAFKSTKISERIFKLKPKEINTLDFGMGWGHWSYAAKACGLNIYGAELSLLRKNFAEKNGIQVIDPFKKEFNEFFHFINTDQVFEHLSDPYELLHNLVKSLKKNGVIKIFVPTTFKSYLRLKFFKKDWRPRHDAFHPLEHINSFNYNSLLKLTQKNNLIPLKPKEVNSDYFSILKSKFKMFLNVPSWYFKKE